MLKRETSDNAEKIKQELHGDIRDMAQVLRFMDEIDKTTDSYMRKWEKLRTIINVTINESDREMSIRYV